MSLPQLTPAQQRMRILRVITILAILFVPVLLAIALRNSTQHYRTLPIYGERLAVSATGDTTYHQLPPFAFVNQDARPLTADSLRGKIHIANFFFTTCPGICKQLSSSMAHVQHELWPSQQMARDLALVSYTIDPERDSLPALRAYAQRYQANHALWQLVRGPQPEVFKLALKGYLVPVQQDGKGPEDGFTHSEMLVLVDGMLRVRGFYDGLQPAQVKRLIEDVRMLRLEHRDGYTHKGSLQTKPYQP